MNVETFLNNDHLHRGDINRKLSRWFSTECHVKAFPDGSHASEKLQGLQIELEDRALFNVALPTQAAILLLL